MFIFVTVAGVFCGGVLFNIPLGQKYWHTSSTPAHSLQCLLLWMGGKQSKVTEELTNEGDLDLIPSDNQYTASVSLHLLDLSRKVPGKPWPGFAMEDVHQDFMVKEQK